MPNHAGDCVKTPREHESRKNRLSHFGCGAFLFLPRVIRTTLSWSQMTKSEFSHSLALQRTRRERRGCHRCVPCAGSLSLGR